MDTLEQFYQQHSQYRYQFPDFDPAITENEKFNWILNSSRIPYLPVQLDGPWSDILGEIQALDHMFVEHRYGDSQGWSSLCLHGLGTNYTDAPFRYPEYRDVPNEQLPYIWTELSTLCPVATEYFKNQFPYEKYERLRFMRLAPGGYIMPHTDANRFIPGAVNISLNNPVGCEMVLEDIGIVPFSSTGGAMLFNTSYRHMVWNRSNEPRYHMIVHGRWKYQWGNFVVKSYKHQLSL